ncbi:hypothetical protein ACF0H5_009152 [Mactra antiquata]
MRRCVQLKTVFVLTYKCNHTRKTLNIMAKLKLLMDGLITLCLLLDISGCFKLDSRCHFVREYVHCLRANLTYIPKIPDNVSGLLFSDNYLPHVTSDTFMNISDPKKITYLRLAFDHIKTIKNDSLESFTGLISLSLTGNHIEAKSLRYLLGVLCHVKITMLTLNSMGSSIRSLQIFSLLNNCEIKELFMKRNAFVNITRGIVQHFDNVKFLDLCQNRIKLFQLTYMKSLEKLELSHNRLTNVPIFCMGNKTSASMVPKIRGFFIRYNYITNINPKSFECLTSLIELRLGGNHIAVFPNDMLLKMPFIQSLTIQPYNDYNTYVEKYAFRSNSLSYLQFESLNRPANLIFHSINDTFKNSPNLTYLHLAFIYMNTLPVSSLHGLFAPLKRLKNFSCYDCEIQRNPSIFIGDMTELVKLNLEENSLESINDNSISSKRYLKFLYLNDNKFSHLSRQILPIEFLNQLDLVDFAENPFLCNCALEWFIEWLKTTDTKIRHSDHYICAGPDRLAGKSLFDVEFTYFECHPLKPWMWAIIIVSFFLVILIISVLVYCNRWNIKHLIYLYRMKRNYKQIDGDNYLYDAFVAYSQDDSDWVIDKLLPILETESGYKLCIHERDFGVGAYINDNIVQNINNSKRMILVLSESFVNSGWCTFELKVALGKHIEEDFPVIVIILQEVRHMNSSLKILLKMTTYLEWKDGGAEEDLFWNKLQRTFKT